MKKFAFLGLVLAFVLTIVVPTSALAAPKTEDFYAEGKAITINMGDVKPIAGGLLWQVKSRQVTGTITGSVNGDFLFEYNGKFQLTQAGSWQGRMTVGEDCKIQLKGTSEAFQPLGFEPGIPPLVIGKLYQNGTWNAEQNGRVAKGDLVAWAKVATTMDGHVIEIRDSSFQLKGKWLNKS